MWRGTMDTQPSWIQDIESASENLRVSSHKASPEQSQKKTRLACFWSSYISFFISSGELYCSRDWWVGGFFVKKKSMDLILPIAFKELWIVISSQISLNMGRGRREWGTTRKKKKLLLFRSKEILRRSLGKSRGERKQNFRNKSFYIFLRRREINILKSVFCSHLCFHMKLIFCNCLGI